MHRTLSFALKFLASLWLVLAGTFLFLLLLNRPHVPELAPFSGISIANDRADIYLPNRIFTCVETAQNFQCKAPLQNQPLVLDFTKGNEYKYGFTDCRAAYQGQLISCQKTGTNYAPLLSDSYEIKNLKLNAFQIKALKKEYWGINFLMELGDSGLTRLSLGLSLLLGVIAAIFTQSYPGRFSKVLTSVICGFVLSCLIWSFLGRVPFDAVIPYGFSPDTWGWVVSGVVIAMGIGTTLITAVQSWKKSNRPSIFLVGINSIGTALLSVAFFMVILLNWGYID